MKRHPEAPVEASKFMGHGICETFSRSMSIGEPESGGRGRQESATSNADILGDAAWKLLRDLNFDPKELRGLGLQITKLESSGEESSTTADQAMESGQTRLAFKSEAKVTSKSFTGVPSSSNDYHPTEETLDFEALEALPEDIRAEVMAQLKTNGVVPGPSVSHTTNPLIDATEERPFLKAGLGTTTMSLNDQTAEGFAIGTLATPIVIDEDIGVPISMKPASTRAPSKNVAHITRQLRPKAKAVVTTPIKDGAPTSHSIFSKRRWGVIVTEEEIKELGFDPDVFYALPADLQREQLRLERENQKPARENVISSKKIAFGDAFTRVSRSPAPRSGFKLEAKFPEKVPLKVTHTRSGGSDDAEPSAKVKLVELGDIQAYVKRWTSTSHATGLAPSKAGIEGLKEWLVKYMGQEGSGTGMERVVVVLRWWRELLRKFWSEQEKLSADSAARAGVGAEWWSAFGECKDAVDRISKQRFGGKISLR
jgi:DNA repair protein REV1